MNENIKVKSMYEIIPIVSGLNKVPGFNPLKFMRKTVSKVTKQEVMYLDLKYKKLWFKLACPKGQVIKTPLKITEKIAIIEAKVFYDKNDDRPASTFVAERYTNNIPGYSYIKAAQEAAEYEALTDAGFGIQLCDVTHGPDTEMYDAGLPINQTVSVNTENVVKTNELTAAANNNLLTEKTDETVEFVVETSEIKEDESTTDLTEQTNIVTQTPPVVTDLDDTEQNINKDNTNETTEEMEITTKSESAGSTVSSIQSLIQSAQSNINENIETEPTDETQTQEISSEIPRFTADMPVDKILEVMTIEEAGAFIIDSGVCNGWMMADVAEKRFPSLKWYITGYPGKNNVMKAAAQMMFDYMNNKKAS
jgi:hypothetical protein